MRISPSHVWVLALLLLGACSKDSHQARREPAPAGAVTATLTPLDPESANVLRAQLDAGGIPADYAAHFVDGRIERIVEHRRLADTVLPGEYSFEGGRLLHYRGTQLERPNPIELEFDLQGRLVSGRDPQISEREIAAIRARGQLLRSHALARRATQTH